MKTLSKIVLATTLAVAAMGAHASDAGKVYAGVKIGQFNTDLFMINKKATNYGVYGGYNFNQHFGIEGEYMGSESKGYAIDDDTYKYDAKTFGVYGTYRYNFADSPIYLKGKAGIAKTDVKDKGTNNTWDAKLSTTNMAAGVGVGFKAGDALALEAGYNYLNSDSNYWGIGATFTF